MAPAVYPFFRAQMARGLIDCVNDTFVAYLVDLADYTYSGAHQYLTDLPAGARVDSATLSGLTVSDAAVWDANDFTFAAASGDPSEAVIIVRSTGVEATSELAVFYDGLSVTPNGGDIVAQVNAGGLAQL